MPSIGLTTDQMCAAIRDFGLAPCLTTQQVAHHTKAEILASLRSFRAPILVLESLENPVIRHAVTVVGAKYPTSAKSPASPTPQDGSVRYFDNAVYEVEDLYVHDDRLGPYVLARMRDGPPVLRADDCRDFLQDVLATCDQENSQQTDTAIRQLGIRLQRMVAAHRELHLSLRIEKGRRYPPVPPSRSRSSGELEAYGDVNVPPEQDVYDHGWRVVAVLTPSHIRQHFSCSDLLDLGFGSLHARLAIPWAYLYGGSDGVDADVSLSVSIPRGKNYAWLLLRGYGPQESRLALGQADATLNHVVFSRYVGVLHYGLRGSSDWIDVIVDTTSTPRSPHYLAVVAAVDLGSHGYLSLIHI